MPNARGGAWSHDGTIGTPSPLFRARLLPTGANIRQQYDVTRDGQRFLLNVVAEDAPLSTITVVENWTAGLKK